MRIWKSSLLALILAALLLFGIIFGLEMLLAGDSKASQLWNTAVPTFIISVVLAGIAIVLADLLLQGHETLVYQLDSTGAHLQTWHKPSYLKSWTRLQERCKEHDYTQANGLVMHLSQERHFIWRDIQDVKYLPRQSSILLYHTPSCAPMVLRMQQEEYELAAAFVAKYSKKKPGRK